MTRDGGANCEEAGEDKLGDRPLDERDSGVRGRLASDLQTVRIGTSPELLGRHPPSAPGAPGAERDQDVSETSEPVDLTFTPGNRRGRWEKSGRPGHTLPTQAVRMFCGTSASFTAAQKSLT